ncbi:MAG: sulfatase-like hydrolase/transferase [Deltaproteobacteria bacterium]|nr:sulfatase-like hydrolase/transferase [Deltaproteobacteria bacterium]
MLSLALLFGAIACRRDAPDPLEAARKSLSDAFSRHDVTALSDALANLRAVNPQSPAELSELAVLMMRAGETAHALWLLESGISDYPDRDELRILVARAALVVGDPIRVLAVLDPIAVDSDQHLTSLMLRARAQLELGDLDAALAYFEDAQQRYPDSPHASHARVLTLLREGRVEDARGVIEEARGQAQTPERIQELDVLVAQIEFAQGERDAGLERMRALVEKSPDEIQLRQMLSRSLQAAGQLEEALEVARDGLSRNPEHPTLQALVAWAYVLLGRQEEAEQSLRTLVERTDSPSAYLLFARFLLFTGQTEAAAASLSEAAERHAGIPMLRVHEAETWIDLGDVERAHIALEEFQRLAADDPHAVYLQARLALAAGDAKRAASELSRVVSNLDRAYTQYWLARALEEAGDPTGARRRYGLAMLRDRSHPAPAVALMRLAEERSDWKAAAEHAGQLVARFPAGSEGYGNLATFLARAGEGGSAEAAARLYMQRFPEREDAPALMAMSLRVQGKLAEATEVLDAAESAHGSVPEYAHERALILGSQGDAEAAIRLVGVAIAERPDEPRYYSTLAALAFSSGDLETGGTAVDSALAIDPTFLEPLKLRATFRAATRDLEGASADLGRYLAARPYDAAMHFMRGVVFEQEGRHAEALVAYHRSIELDEAAFAPYNNLAMLLVEMGEIDEAVRMANRAYARASANPQVVETLGWVYLKKGLAARSVKLLERARAMNPNSAATQRHLELAYHELGDADDAPVPNANPDEGATSSAVTNPGDPESSRPNIVLVIVDTLRPDWTTPYGDTRGVTPELARWAAHGVVFETVRAQSSWTKVSVASMMTSLWPIDHGVREVRDALGDGANTLAEQFQNAGYATYGVQSNGWLAATFGFQQGFDRYVFPRGANVPWMKSMVWPHADNVYLEAERLLDAHADAEPFFLYLHFMDVHEYAAPAEFQQFGTDSAGAYRAAIRWIDHVLERLRVKLAAMGQLENTVLILASDHGETFGEDRRWGHARNARTPALRVPLVIRLPETAKPLRVSNQTRNLDLAPTLLDLAGIAIPQSFQGESLLPLLNAEAGEAARDRTTYASLPALLFRDATLQESVSTGSWSFARDFDDSRREHLYDLHVDPDEEVNLIEIEPEAADRLRPLLDAQLRRTPLPGTVRSDIRIDPQIADKLRALGYLQ